MFSIFKAEDGADTIESFNASKIAKSTNGKKAMSKIMEYRDISFRCTLAPGRYIIVPSTKNAGDYGKYFLNIYFNHGQEVKHTGDEFKGYKYAEFRYTNPHDSEYLKYKTGGEIKEEDEDETLFSDDMKKLLHLK